MAEISKQITAKGLTQEEAVTAAESAVRAMGLRTASPATMADGSIVIPSILQGANMPVLVALRNGAVVQGTATLKGVIEGTTIKMIVTNLTPK